ncbi:MAG: V-type ATPase subunit [Spirochaetes bacterium]|nr:V-type ATPase subunit [Spirochaetota bacterium]
MSRYRPDAGYAFITGAIRALETREIGAEVVRQVAGTGSEAEAMAVLRGTYLQECAAGRGDPGSFPQLAGWVRAWMLEIIDRFSRGGELMALFRLEFDYHNIKVLLRGRASGRGLSGPLMQEGTVSLEELVPVIQEGRYGELPASLGGAVEECESRFRDSGDPRSIDLAADRRLFQDLLGRLDQIGSPFIRGYYRLLADLTNLQGLLATGGDGLPAWAFVPGGEIAVETLERHRGAGTGEIAAVARAAGLESVETAAAAYPEDILAFGRESARTLAEYRRGARYDICGAEPLFAFGKTVEADIAVLGTLIGGRGAGLPVELIMKRVPPQYTGGTR